MTERPLLFSPPMVGALLEGRKTQTRRVVKCDYSLRSVSSREEFCRASPYPLNSQIDRNGFYFQTDTTIIGLRCPYGQPGDWLWVKETHWLSESGHQKVLFDQGMNKRIWTKNCYWRKKSSLWMPKWAARIWLEITRVRAERLQDISEEDVIAEGIEVSRVAVQAGFHRERFAELWNSLHPQNGMTWKQNPWVWIIEFQVLKGDATSMLNSITKELIL